MDSFSSKIRPILVCSMSSYDIWLVTTVVMYDCNTGRKYAIYVPNATLLRSIGNFLQEICPSLPVYDWLSAILMPMLTVK